MNSPVPALAGQDLTARDLICVKPRRYNLGLFMLHCNKASGQATCARQAWLVHAARFQREFPDHVAVMRELRGAGLARTEVEAVKPTRGSTCAVTR
jgi:hypothetical protein